jgi:flavorubredoxin
MEQYDLARPVEIDTDIYWVGSSEEALLRRNIYLRVFRVNGKTSGMIVDPGPECDFYTLKNKVETVIGKLNRVGLIFINHQDPDVAPNALKIQDLNPKALTLMTEDTWRLVQFFRLNPDRFRAVEKYRNLKVNLRSSPEVQPEYRLQFIPTPFCHFRGSCMVYDVNSRILFSGDFLGGISTSDLYAEEPHWEGVKAFHQLYFPSKRALNHAINKIRAIDPPPLMIAPQHGAILKGEMIDLYMDRMANLDVGLDIITHAGGDLSRFLDLANDIANIAEQEIGSISRADIFKVFHPDGSYPALFTLDKNHVVRDIKGSPREAVEALIQVTLSFSDNDQTSSKIKQRLLECLQDHELSDIESFRELAVE